MNIAMHSLFSFKCRYKSFGISSYLLYHAGPPGHLPLSTSISNFPGDGIEPSHIDVAEQIKQHNKKIGQNYCKWRNKMNKWMREEQMCTCFVNDLDTEYNTFVFWTGYLSNDFIWIQKKKHLLDCISNSSIISVIVPALETCVRMYCAVKSLTMYHNISIEIDTNQQLFQNFQRSFSYLKTQIAKINWLL